MADERTLQFRNTESAQGRQEIATAVRILSETQASLDLARGTLSLTGTAAQLALSQWLFEGMDLTAGQVSPGADPREYVMREASDGDNTVHLLYLRRGIEAPQELQEIATLVRSIADIRRVFTYNTLRVLAIRGTPDQLRLAEWLADRLTQDPPPRELEYRTSAASDDLVRVFFLPAGTTNGGSDCPGRTNVSAPVNALYDLLLYYSCLTPDSPSMLIGVSKDMSPDLPKI